MPTHKFKDMGAQWELYFENRSPNAFGSLLYGGACEPMRHNDWSDIRRLCVWSNYVLVMLQEKGSGSYRNENGFACQLSYGDFFFVFPGFKQLQGPGKNESWHTLYAGFSGAAFDCCRDQKIIHPSRPVWRLSDPEPWITRLRAMLQAPRPTTTLGVTREAAEFLAFLSQMLELALPLETGAASSDWFTHACVLLTNDLSRKINLTEVAADLGMSYSTFRLNFVRRAGMPPARYRDRQRIQAACDLMQHSNKSCRVIAANLGYCSEQYFSTFFKASTGLAPREYRKQHQT